jgi:anti-anti-sigma regulatory factor
MRPWVERHFGITREFCLGLERAVRNIGRRGNEMPVVMEQSETKSIVRLDETVSIESAAELKECLLEVLNVRKDIEISLAQVKNLDITAMQLLWAAEHAAKALGIGFRFLGPLAEEVSLSLSDAGFEPLVVSSEIV